MQYGGKIFVSRDSLYLLSYQVQEIIINNLAVAVLCGVIFVKYLNFRCFPFNINSISIFEYPEATTCATW